jgi:hypothetical protein
MNTNEFMEKVNKSVNKCVTKLTNDLMLMAVYVQTWHYTLG